MFLKLFLSSFLALQIFACGSENGGGIEPAPNQSPEQNIVNPNGPPASSNPQDSDQGFSLAGVYGLTTDHMIELFNDGSYRFYIKSPRSSDYLIEQGSYQLTAEQITIAPQYTTCMVEGNSFTSKTYKFAVLDSGSISIEGVEFPAIAAVDVTQLKEEVCAAPTNDPSDQ